MTNLGTANPIEPQDPVPALFEVAISVLRKVAIRTSHLQALPHDRCAFEASVNSNTGIITLIGSQNVCIE